MFESLLVSNRQLDCANPVLWHAIIRLLTEIEKYSGRSAI